MSQRHVAGSGSAPRLPMIIVTALSDCAMSVSNGGYLFTRCRDSRLGWARIVMRDVDRNVSAHAASRGFRLLGHGVK